MLDIFPNSNKALVESVYKINSYEAIRVLLEKAFTEELPSGTYPSELDYLMYIFGTVEIGHFVQIAQNLDKDADGKWYKVDGSISSTLSTVYGIKPIIIIGLAYYLIMGEPIAPLLSEYMPDAETIGDVVGDLGFKFAPLTDYTLNKSLYEFVDALVDGNYAYYGYNSRLDYLKGMYDDLRVGHFVQDALKVQRLEDGDWYKEGDVTKPVFRFIDATYDVRIIYLIEFTVKSIKNKKFEYHTLYGDIYGEDTTIGYYLSQVFKHEYNEEKGVYTDANGYVTFNALKVLYDKVPYDYFLDAKTNGFKVASENFVDNILIGDLICDIVEVKLAGAKIKATKDAGVYVNNGEWANLADTIYNISLLEIIKNVKNAQYFKDKFFNLLIGDYIASAVKLIFNKLKYTTEIVYSKEESAYIVKYEFNKVCSLVFNKSIQQIIDGANAYKDVTEPGRLVNNFAEYVTNDWLGTIYVGDFFHKGLFHYDETADCWYDEDEVVPLDFDLMSILYKRALTLSVYKLTHNFNYMTLIEDLFLGNTMALTRYMELQFGSDPIIYVDAERTYTLDADGNEVKFPYEIHMLNAEYYYTKDGWDYPLEIKKSIWYETKLFEHQFNVDVAKDENGVYTVADNESGVVYPCEYMPLTDNYKVIINGETQYFKIYHGTIYWAEESGDFKRFSQNFVVQKIADIQLKEIMQGFNIEKMLGEYYLGDIMSRYKGDEIAPAGSLSYRKDATYKWYRDKELTQELTGIDAVISNIVLGRIFDGTIDFAAEIQELTVRDVFADADKIGILKLFADTKLGELEEKFNSLKVGEIMEYTQKDIFVDSLGNYVFPTSIDGASYNFYLRKDDVNTPITVLNDGTYYYEIGGVRYNLTQRTGVWVDDNDIIAGEAYEVTQAGLVYDRDGTLVGTVELVSGDLYRTIKTGGSGAIDGMDYLVNRNDTWHRAYSDGEIVVTVASALITIFADLKVSDFAENDFVDTITTKVKDELAVGEFFTPSNNGVFSLFTQEELDNILIKDFSQACTTKVKQTSIYDFEKASLIDGVRDGEGNLTGVFKIFTEDELKNITIANFSSSITSKVNLTDVGVLVDAGLINIDGPNQTKLSTYVPGWREMTVNEVLSELFSLLP